MEIKKISAPPVSDHKLLKIYHRNIFVYDSSEADERFFRQGIADFIRNLSFDYLTFPGNWNSDEGVGFKQHMVGLVWQRNHLGTTSKYMYFNDRSQKLYLDNAVWEWAKLAGRMIAEELSKVKQTA